ncbi:MAG: hypothetical protein ACE5F6_16340, partial [Anaerolineae bacterium]
MSYLSGFIATVIDEQGNSDVARINLVHRKEILYGIDSETVEGLNIFQGRRQLKPTIAVEGGKTLVKFSAKPEKWLGMTYRRVGFVTSDEGLWSYCDQWYIPNETMFMLMLPPYAVVRSLNAEGLKRNQFDLENHLVMTQFFSGGDLDIRLEYVVNSEEYVANRPATLERSSFPHTGDMLLQTYQSDSFAVRKALTGLSSTVSWVA